jgi:hypothetical protein
MVEELPKYGEWTVDRRLRQFRKVEQTPEGPSIVFADFDSPEGLALVKEYCEEKLEMLRDECQIYGSNIIDIDQKMIDADTIDNMVDEMIGEG